MQKVSAGLNAVRKGEWPVGVQVFICSHVQKNPTKQKLSLMSADVGKQKLDYFLKSSLFHIFLN